MRQVLALVAIMVIMLGCGKQPENGPMLRTQITSANRKAALNYEETNKKWPKTASDLSGDPAIRGLPAEVVQKVRFELKEAKPDGDAVYEFSFDGAHREIPIRPRWKTPKEPAAAGF
jgi:hypothetical protein